MTITVVSSTVSPEQIAAADAVAASKENKAEPVAGESQAESEDASGASEEEEGKEAALATDGEEETEEDDDSGESKDAPKRKNGRQRKIDKLSKAKSLAEQERDYWKEQAMKAAPKEEPKIDKRAEAADGKPDVNDFETYEAFHEALTDWKIEQKEKAYASKQKETQLKTEHQKQMDSFKEKSAEFKKANKDFDDVLESVDDVPLPIVVQQVLLKSGPELAYALAKNREEMERICALSPIDAAEALGEFKAKFLSKETPKKQTTKAPNPINPVGGSGSANTTKSIFDRDITQAEYERLRAKQLAKKSG
jgi:hypothetical protein